MSVITSISIQSYANDLGGKIWNPAIRWRTKHAVFVEIHDDAGLVGLGECWCFDAAPDALIAYIRTEIIPEFIGFPLNNVPDVMKRLVEKATLTARHGILASALSGVDIAVWDLLAKQAAQPLWAHLNPAGSGSALLYASGGLYGDGKGTPELIAEMSGFNADGFRLSKMKIGGSTMQHDIDRVQAVIASLPTDAQLIVDGVYSYSSDKALKIFESLPEGRIAAFQSPVKASDIAGMKRLSRAGVPVMATEAEYREELHHELVAEAEVAFLQTAPVACGGITRVRAMSDMVQGTATQLSLEVSSTAIALMAACHLAASDDCIAHVEYHTVHQVFFDQLTLQRPDEAGKRSRLPEAVGMGIELSRKKTKAEFAEHVPGFELEPRKAALSH